MLEKLTQVGICNTCERETEDKYYIFCSIECREVWLVIREKQMGQYDIDKDLYKNWFEEKTIAIEKMSREDIEARINEIKKIEFFAKREWALLHQQYDKITGKKGIAPWLKEERDKLITDPDIKVNWDEPRKKEKKPKENLVKNLLGFDISELTRELKEGIKKDKTQIDMGSVIDQLVESPIKVEPAKPTQEEVEDKAAKLRERMRLAKEGKAQ